MCSADVLVSQLQWFPCVRHTDIRIESTFTTSRGDSVENNREAGRTFLNLTLLLRLALSWTQPRSYFLVHWVHKFVCVHPNQIQRFHACTVTLLHWNHFVHTFIMHPINLFTSRSQHKIFWQIPTVDIIPESSPFFQDLIILKIDFWYWACKFLNCILLIILFRLFTKRLQNLCNQFWKTRVQQRGVHLRVHPVSLPNFLCMLFKVAQKLF